MANNTALNKDAVEARLANGESLRQIAASLGMTHQALCWPENLLVLTRAEHRRLHAELESIAFSLLREGVLVFRDGHYVRAE